MKIMRLSLPITLQPRLLADLQALYCGGGGKGCFIYLLPNQTMIANLENNYSWCKGDTLGHMSSSQRMSGHLCFWNVL